MPDPAPLRWGILGCARITRRGLIPGIRGSTSGTLHALASRDLDGERLGRRVLDPQGVWLV